MIITFTYGVLMTYSFHPKTMLLFEVEGAGLYQLFVGLSGYSLFSMRCPELAIYRDNE